VTTDKKLKSKREIFLFLIVGAIATSVDFIVYFVLVDFDVTNELAKSISFLSGVLVGYLGNVNITFHHAVPRPSRYLLVYALSLLINVSINSITYSVSGNGLLSWILATTSSTTLNYLGLRHFAFTQKV
jgi:putative flippase GtrA